MSTKPTDDEILDVLKGRGGTMTYVIRNILSSGRPNLQTAFIRYRLMTLEKAGKVKRMPTSYATQICWGLSANQQEKGGK